MKEVTQSFMFSFFWYINPVRQRVNWWIRGHLTVSARGPYLGSALWGVLSFSSSSCALPVGGDAQGTPNMAVHSLPCPCFKAMISRTTKAACNAYLTPFLRPWPWRQIAGVLTHAHAAEVARGTCLGSRSTERAHRGWAQVPEFGLLRDHSKALESSYVAKW